MDPEKLAGPAPAGDDSKAWAPSPISAGSPRGGISRSVSPLSVDASSRSCVALATSDDDCARHRFIAWAAVRRNSWRGMSDSEKLECPLLRCRQRFTDHEQMLKHLARCEHLSSCEYWCYEHMRVERFDDSKCKRCLGHPSKRRKMMSMAKHFFSSLGHKSKKSPPRLSIAFDDTSIAPPPSYDSLSLGHSQRPSQRVELPVNEIIAEIDSNELSIPQSEPVIDPQALLVPELDSTSLRDESFMLWDPTPHIKDPPFSLSEPRVFSKGPSQAAQLSIQVTASSPETSHPALPRRHECPFPAVATRSKNLSPSSSVRSTTSTMSSISSIISPISTWSSTSNAWSMVSGADTDVTSPSSDPVSPSGLVAAEAFTESCHSWDNSSDFLHTMFSELPAELPGPSVSMPQDPCSDSSLFFDTIAPTQPSNVSNLVLPVETSSSLAVTDNLDHPLGDAEDSAECCSEVKAMVSTVQDTLREHVCSSVAKVNYLRFNPLVGPLCSMDMKAITEAGLRALRSIVSNSQPVHSVVDVLCFIHLIFAFSLVIHEGNAANWTRSLFSQAMAYLPQLAVADQMPYVEIVSAIWQPAETTAADQDGSPSLISSEKGKGRAALPSSSFGQDALVATARQFLDELEITTILSQSTVSSEVYNSGLWAKHLRDSCTTLPGNSPFTVTATYILNVLLAQKYANVPELRGTLQNIYRGINSGAVRSVRRLELELLQAGKTCLSMKVFFGSYSVHVADLCDQLYRTHDSDASRRTVYYDLDITLLESVIFDSMPTASARSPATPAAVEDNQALDDLFAAMTTDLCDGADEPFDVLNPALALPRTDAAENDRMTDEVAIDLGNLPDTESSAPNLSTAIPSPQQRQQQLQQMRQQENDQRQQPTDKVERRDEFQQPKLGPESPSTPSPSSPSQARVVESDACCELCGYRPKGHPQWFKGSMAKHKRVKHSPDPPRIYKCRFPGCNSQYRNRPDNLRQHQIEKQHWVEGDELGRRPSKRKKVSE